MHRRLISACLLAAVGCGGGDAGDSGPSATDSGGGLDAPRTEDAGPASTTTITASEGGTATSLDGLFEILVAPGALSEDTEIVISRVVDADVPADIAASTPLSAVYAVEPDGLVFGGDGAIVHYHFDSTPAALQRDGRFGAAFAVSRSREGGAAQWQGEPSTVVHDGQADVFAPLAHLSYQWAVAHDAGGEEYFLGVDFDDPHEARVGDRWSPRIDVQASVTLTDADVVRWVADGSALDVETSSVGVPDGLDRVTEVFFGSDGRARFTPDARVGAPPLAADRPHEAGSAPRFYCARVGEGYQIVSAHLTSGSAAPSLFVSDPEATHCIERTGPEIRILDTLPGERDGATITTRGPAELEAEVESRTSDTHTAVLPGSPWFATFDRPGAAPAPGPDTITATNGGATATATRDAVTGRYTTLVDDPAVWDVDAITAVTFGGLPTPRAELMPAPPIGLPFGPVDGLDTMVHGSDGGELELRMRFPGTTRCMADDVSDLVIFRRLDGSAAAVPLREGLLLAATYCGRTIEALTGLPFVVEVSSVERAQLATSSGVLFISVGHGLRVDGTAFTTVCAPGLTYCFDRCVDTATDPLNCGSCGGIPLEVCDMLDNDCDGRVDEGCPGSIQLYSGDDAISPHFGDTTRPAGTANSVICPRAITGLCGSTNSDGSIRQILGICGVPTLRRITTSTPYTFAIDVTDTGAPGACLGGLTGGGSTGGAATFEVHCPANMLAEGIAGEATTTIQSLRLHCAEWVPTQDRSGLWVIRRGMTMDSPLAGTGSGTPFTWIAPEDTVDMNPALVRNLRNRWFPPSGGISDVIDLWASGRAAELIP